MQMLELHLHSWNFYFLMSLPLEFKFGIITPHLFRRGNLSIKGLTFVHSFAWNVLSVFWMATVSQGCWWDFPQTRIPAKPGKTQVKMWVSRLPDLCSFSQVTLLATENKIWRLSHVNEDHLHSLERECNSVHSPLGQPPIGTITILISLRNQFQLSSVFVSFIRELTQKISQQMCCC